MKFQRSTITSADFRLVLSTWPISGSWPISQNSRHPKCDKTKTVKYLESALGHIIHNINVHVHAKIQVNTSKFWVDVFLKRDFPSVARLAPLITAGSCHEKTSDQKLTKYPGD